MSKCQNCKIKISMCKIKKKYISSLRKKKTIFERIILKKKYRNVYTGYKNIFFNRLKLNITEMLA